MTYGKKIKRLRDALLVSQEELANILGVSKITINRWENEKFEPSLKAKRKLRKLFLENKIIEEGGK